MILYTLNGNGYIDIAHVDNKKGLHVYVNLTNRCPCACTFCLRKTKVMEESNTLWLSKEPNVEEVLAEFEKYDLTDFEEVVFCGFGEPLERVDDVEKISRELKKKRSDLKIRINTNGLANLIHKKDVSGQLRGCVDIVSISLNAPDKQEYLDLTRSKFGIVSYDAMLEFAKSCKEVVPSVVLSVVSILGEEKISKCQKICDDLGVTLRVRPYEE